MIIPHEELRRQTLIALIEEFVTRNGAVHGQRETAIEARVAAVLEQLNSGRAVVVFDEATETASIAMREGLREPTAADAPPEEAAEQPDDYQPDPESW